MSITEEDRHQYTLRQYIMLRRVTKPYETWTQVMDFASSWFARHPDMDPDDTGTYHHWLTEVGMP